MGCRTVRWTVRSRNRPREKVVSIPERGAVAGTRPLEVLGSLDERADARFDLSVVVAREPSARAESVPEPVREVTEERGGEVLVDVDDVAGRVPRRVVDAKSADGIAVLDVTDG